MVILGENKNLTRTPQLSAKDEGSMASASETSLQTAVKAVENALAQLDAAAEIAIQARTQNAAEREAAQVEISKSWQEHSAQLEATLAEAQSENSFLKEDNLRMANQLQALQRDYLELQKTAGKTVGRLDAAVRQLDLVLEA